VVTDGQANLVSGGQVSLKEAGDKSGDNAAPGGDKPRRRSRTSTPAAGGTP
jgi:hypothetical protein